jgi:hypothetical protein
MSRFTYLLFCLAVLFPGISRASEDSTNELTGIFHKAEKTAFLEIDGSGFISRILVTGDPLKDLADGTRVWIKGRIETYLYGHTDMSERADQLQQRPTQWFIVFRVEKCRKIAKPFERPQDDELQNKHVEATR